MRRFSEEDSYEPGLTRMFHPEPTRGSEGNP
jgi:hypothetical protein